MFSICTGTSIRVRGLSSTATAGTPQTVTATVRDAFGNVATGYTGTVHFSSSDPNAVLPSNFTFTAADGGTVTFPVTFGTAGKQTRTVADTGNHGIRSTTANVAVSSLTTPSRSTSG